MERRILDRTGVVRQHTRARHVALAALTIVVLGAAGCSVDVKTSTSTDTTDPVDVSSPTSGSPATTTATASTDAPPTTRDPGAASFRAVDPEELCDLVSFETIADRVGLEVTDSISYTGSIGYSDVLTQQEGCSFELDGDNEVAFAVVAWDDGRPFDSAGFAQLQAEEADSDDVFPDDQPYEGVDSLGVPAFFVGADTRNRLYIDTGVQVLCVAGGTFDVTLERSKVVAVADALLDAIAT